MAQSSKEGHQGALGVTEACRNIERLGWGTTVNSRHDFGTDLFMLVIGRGGEDQGLIVGAQVKTGSSYFKEERFSDKGALEGWWYRDRKRSHVDSWASHAVPHLIILHDLETENSHWAHVTPESIVPTGKGAKVFVPKANLIDAAHREKLEKVAATNVGGAFEGSVWAGKPPPNPVDALRYALIVPRLIAPHPNAGTGEPLTAEQGLALVVQDRLRDYERFAEEHKRVPSLQKARTSKRWGWRLIGALALWLFKQDAEELIAALESAPDPPGRAAASVLAAGALIESGDVSRATALLERSMGGAEYGAVDCAWLAIQHARCCIEVGRLDEARRAALEVHAIRPHAGRDVTAAALLGAAATLVFNTSGWDSKKLDEVITAGDTAALWWRSQTTRYGLDALAERNFKSWSRETAITFGAEDTVEHQLESSALLANNGADQGGWRHLNSLRGQSELMGLDRLADPEEAHKGLRRLLLAGDTPALKLAVRHLIADGPASAVSMAGEDLRLGEASRTSAHAELTLLHQGGSMIETSTADRIVRWILATLADPDTYGRRISPTFVIEWALLEALGGVIGAAGLRVQRQVIRYVSELPPQRNQALATEWCRVLSRLPQRAWSKELALQAKPRSGRHDSALQVALLGAAASYDQGARRSLHNRARRGSLDALSALGKVTDLPPGVAAELIAQMAKQLRRLIAEAHKGQFGFGGHDIAETLVLLNAWHPQLAKWKPVLDLLSDSRVAVEQKQRALVVLANLADRLPESVCNRLRPIALALAREEKGGWTNPFDADQNLIGRASNLAIVLGAIDLEENAAPLAELLGGDAEQRRWAVFIATHLRRSSDVGSLAALSADPHPMVRAAASGGLGVMLGEGIGGDLVAASLRRCMADGGTWVPDAIAGVLGSAERPGPVARELLGELKGHPSAVVRASARGGI